jgi:hypothetical protein
MIDSVMLRIVCDLQGFGIVATDDETGDVERFYFGDDQWRAEEHHDLERAINSSQLLAAINCTQSSADLNHAREEVRHIPEFDSHELSRHEHETTLHQPEGQTGDLLN